MPPAKQMSLSKRINLLKALRISARTRLRSGQPVGLMYPVMPSKSAPAALFCEKRSRVTSIQTSVLWREPSWTMESADLLLSNCLRRQDKLHTAPLLSPYISPNVKDLLRAVCLRCQLSCTYLLTLAGTLTLLCNPYLTPGQGAL